VLQLCVQLCRLLCIFWAHARSEAERCVPLRLDGRRRTAYACAVSDAGVGVGGGYNEQGKSLIYKDIFRAAQLEYGGSFVHTQAIDLDG
jgi:hypothetical protein